MNLHKEKIWVEADNWMFEIEQSKNITIKMKRQHMILSEIKRRIDKHELSLSKDSYYGGNVRYIYNKPTCKTDRFKQIDK